MCIIKSFLYVKCIQTPGQFDKKVNLTCQN